MKQYFVFDAYGTLLKVSGDIPGLSDAEKSLSEQVQALWRNRQLEYTWLSSLMGRSVDFNQITNDALDFALESVGNDDPSFREKLMSIYADPTTFDDVIPFLQKCIGHGVSTAILSNGERNKLTESVKTAGLGNVIQSIFSASDIDLFKPSPRVYQMVLDEYGCEASDVTFFSSNAWDISGAKHFGFTTIWVNRTHQPFERLGVSPDKVISNLSEYEI